MRSKSEAGPTPICEPMSSKRSPSASVGAEVNEGTVTLTGRVDRQDHRDAAAFIAKVVPGVVDVENHIEVTGQAPTSDVEY